MNLSWAPPKLAMVWFGSGLNQNFLGKINLKVLHSN